MFLEGMQARGLCQPLLVTHDGCKGIGPAVEKTFPKSDRQRCLVHKVRNILNKVPKEMQDRIHTEVKAIYHAGSEESAKTLAKSFIEAYANSYPSMIKCFNEDLPACLKHLEYPPAHHKFIRTTNLIERAFLEEKRRTKIIPAHVNEKGAVKLVFAVLMRASKRWVRVKMTDLELAQLKHLRPVMRPQDSKNQMISFKLAA
jgi:transposase-like protein